MRRTVILCCWSAFLAAASATGSAAEGRYPTRPIRVVVGFTPGGNPDIVARLLAPRLGEALGQQIVVDNRPGAGGIIGSDIVAKASPDGQTLLSVSSSHVVLPAVQPKLPYDPVRDFVPVTLFSSSAYLLVVPASSSLRSVKDLIAQAKARPGQLNFASAGVGSGTHFATEFFKDRAEIDVMHIPYKGIPEALTETLSGRVQFFMAPFASATALVHDGKLRALGVSAGKRIPGHTDIPTIVEQGVSGYEWTSWSGLLAPRGTPRQIVERLQQEVSRALAAPEVQQRLAALGVQPVGSTPEAFARIIVDEIAVAKRIAQKAGIRAD